MKQRYAIPLVVLALASCSRDYTETASQELPTPNEHISETEIPVGEAVAALNRFLDSTDPVTRGGRRTIARIDRVSAADMLPAATRSGEETPETGDLLYVVNFSNDEGYAVLGADSRLDTILIIGDNGSFDPAILHPSESGKTPIGSHIDSLNNQGLGDLNPDLGGGIIISDSLPGSNPPFTPQIMPGLTAEDLYCEEEDEYYIGSSSLGGAEGLIGDMLSDYTQRQLIQVGEPELADDPTGAVLQVGPLLKTKWNQKNPFNMLVTHLNSAGNPYPIGCTTIATIQILTYLKDINLREKFMITSSTWADFENFIDPKDTTATYTLRHDLAKFALSVADGIGVKYNFLRSRQTFALPVKVKRYLESLGYDVNRIIGFKYNRTQVKIVESIINRHPVFIGALNKNISDGAHAWVIDGYKFHRESNNYFNHCNFGWGGSSNGWYYYKLFNSDDSSVDLDDEESGTQTFNYTWWFRVLIIE